MTLHDIDVVELDRITIVGIVVEAPGEELATEVPAGWKRLWDRLDAIPNRRTDVATEASHDLGGGRYREVLGAEVDPQSAPPASLERVELPAATYVAGRHHGAVEDIGTAFGELQELARARGLVPDGMLLDRGYTPAGDRPHDLFVRVTGG